MIRLRTVILFATTSATLAVMPMLLAGQDADSADTPPDEFDRQLFGPDEKQDLPEEASGKDAKSLQEKWQRELGAAAESGDEDLLRSLAQRMRRAEGLIEQNDSGTVTQDLQEQIVTDLDRLIQQAQKRCRASKPGGQPKPKEGSGAAKPAGNNSRKPGEGQTRQSDAEPIQAIMKRFWGQLPKRDRERMMQSSGEEFLPKYKRLIEAYFRRLAEEGDETKDDK